MVSVRIVLVIYMKSNRSEKPKGDVRTENIAQRTTLSGAHSYMLKYLIQITEPNNLLQGYQDTQICRNGRQNEFILCLWNASTQWLLCDLWWE